MNILRAANVGTVFRLIAAIHWSAVELEYEWVERAIRKLRIYNFYLAELMRVEGWGK